MSEFIIISLLVPTVHYLLANSIIILFTNTHMDFCFVHLLGAAQGAFAYACLCYGICMSYLWVGEDHIGQGFS
jgi:hypothetical protein